MRKSNIRTAVPAALLITATLLAGCGNSQETTTPKNTADTTAAPHGYVEGAEETAEQQSRLVTVDAEDGTAQALDLITGKTTSLGRVENIDRLTTDGRFAYAHSQDGTRILDSGSWMVDHGDHVHYYRAEIRAVGTLKGRQPEHVHSDKARTAVTFKGGTAQVLDRGRLEDGSLRRTATLHDVQGPVVPYARHLLVPTADTDRNTVAVEVRDPKGTSRTVLEERCPALRGAAVTRTGVVYGCADGALFVTEKNGRISAEKIDFDQPVAADERPRSFSHRSLSATLTAPAGDDGIWVLDVTARSWKHLRTGPVVAVNTAGEGSPILALGEDGTLTAYDAESGKEIADRKLLTRPGSSEASHAVIEVDGSRAYLSDPAAKKIYEIDYNDALRTARTFSVDSTPTHMVETGR